VKGEEKPEHAMHCSINRQRRKRGGRPCKGEEFVEDAGFSALALAETEIRNDGERRGGSTGGDFTSFSVKSREGNKRKHRREWKVMEKRERVETEKGT